MTQGDLGNLRNHSGWRISGALGWTVLTLLALLILLGGLGTLLTSFYTSMPTSCTAEGRRGSLRNR